MRNLSDTRCGENQNEKSFGYKMWRKSKNTFCAQERFFFPENRVFYEKMWKKCGTA
jgi:hypothetical protein